MSSGGNMHDRREWAEEQREKAGNLYDQQGMRREPRQVQRGTSEADPQPSTADASAPHRWTQRFPSERKRRIEELKAEIEQATEQLEALRRGCTHVNDDYSFAAVDQACSICGAYNVDQR